MEMRPFLRISDTCVVVKLTWDLPALCPERTVSSEGIAAGLTLLGDDSDRAFAWASSSKTWISRRCFSIWSLISSKSWEFPVWRPARHVVEWGRLEAKFLRLERCEAADLIQFNFQFNFNLNSHKH